MNELGARTAVVILTHFYNDEMSRIYDRLIAEVPESYDVFLLVNLNGAQLSLSPESARLGDALCVSNDERLLGLGYKGKCNPEGDDGNGWSLPGHNDLLMMYFYASHPDYKQYWGMEYDVHYQGNWKTFFDYFENSQADLLGAALYKADGTPHNLLIPFLLGPDGKQIALDRTVRGFYPLHRLSRRALQAIDEQYKEGWTGHYELSWGTLVANRGYQIEDFGGNGEYVAPQNRNRFYFRTNSTWSGSPGNFVFRPPFKKVLPYENTLWHPYKPAGAYVLWDAALRPNLWRKAWILLRTMLWPIVIRIWFVVFWRPLRTAP